MADPIDFYFDFASPYGYLASVRLEELAERHGRGIRWRPVLLGAIFKLTGMKPNMQQPLRGEYLAHDTKRCARLWNIPYVLPACVPMHSLAATRAFYWLEMTQPALAVPFAKAVYHHHFVLGEDAGPREVVARLALPLGVSAAELLAGIEQADVRDRTRAETEQAAARGVFGAPFLFVDQEPFWGADRLDHVDRWLATGGW